MCEAAVERRKAHLIRGRVDGKATSRAHVNMNPTNTTTRRHLSQKMKIRNFWSKLENVRRLRRTLRPSQQTEIGDDEACHLC